jgi:ankyrin repeat protein
LVVALLTIVVFLVRKKRISKSFWLSLAGGAVVMGVIALPPVFWQWLFIGNFAKSSHAADLLTTAAFEGNVRTVRGYLTQGVPLEATNYEGSTATFAASVGDNVRVLELLASKGANLNAVNSYGDSPLEVATRNHNNAAAAFLQSKGAMQIRGTPEQREAATQAIVQREIDRSREFPKSAPVDR